MLRTPNQFDRRSHQEQRLHRHHRASSTHRFIRMSLLLLLSIADRRRAQVGHHLRYGLDIERPSPDHSIPIGQSRLLSQIAAGSDHSSALLPVPNRQLPMQTEYQMSVLLATPTAFVELVGDLGGRLPRSSP